MSLTNSQTVDRARIFCFTQDSTLGKKTYINGVLAGKSDNVDKLLNITKLTIGKGYQGEIGELVGFSRALKDNEIKDTTNYLSAKWSEPVYVGVSCTTGTITGSGCSLSGCSLSEPGTSTTNVSTGSGSLSCTSPFSGTINYTCSDGVFSKTTSCTGGPLCTITGVAGLNNQATLDYATSDTNIPATTATPVCATGYSQASNSTYRCLVTGAATSIVNNCTAACNNNNGAGGTFVTTGLNSNYQYALKACESVYGSGACSSKSCGLFSYYYKSTAFGCNWSTPAESYEFIYSNGGYNYAGQDYGDTLSSGFVAGNNLFVRKRTANALYVNPAWTLALTRLATGCNGITP